MNKTELIKAVAEKVGKSQKDTLAVIDALFEAIGGALVNGDEVKITSFGTFKSVKVDERTARNPQDGSAIKVPAHNKVKFTVSTTLKNAVK